MRLAKGIILFLFAFFASGLQAQCDLELYSFDPTTLDATIIVHDGYGCNPNDPTDDVIDKFIIGITSNSLQAAGVECGIVPDPDTEGFILQNYFPGYVLWNDEAAYLGEDGVLNTGDTLEFNLFGAQLPGAPTYAEPCFEDAVNDGYFDECMEVMIWQINCSNDIFGFKAGEDNCADGTEGNGYTYPDVTPENNLITTGECYENSCDVAIYGFDPNTGDITIKVKDGENCGCNDATLVDGNGCATSTGTHTQNNDGVSHIVLGIHKVDMDFNTECMSANNYPGWTFVAYQVQSLPNPSNPGALTGEFINFNVIEDTYGNTSCFDELLPYPEPGVCYELVIWQINLSQTANGTDFPGNPHVWVPDNYANDTQMYPDFALWDNYITWCQEDPNPPLTEGCTDPNATNYNEDADIDDGSCEYPPVPGCTDPTACNYDFNADENDGSCVWCDPAICPAWIINSLCGCTDEEADNFNEDAIYDDGSCEYSNTDSPDAKPSFLFSSVECGPNGPENEYQLVVFNIGTDTLFRYCVEIPEIGLDECLDGYVSANEWIAPGEGQFVSWVNIPLDGSVTQLTVNVYFAEDELQEDEGNNIQVYTIDLGNVEDPCEYTNAYPDTTAFSFECVNGVPEIVMDIFVGNSGDLPMVYYCVEIPEIGLDICFDGNLDPNLIVQPGEQLNITEYIPSIPFELDYITINISNVSPEESDVFNNSLQVDFSHSTGDDPCIVPGCTDPTANNYNPDATEDDGSCTYDIMGCTDPEANNYNASATVDDGSCTYDVLGCTDPEANNYDPNANVDDGTCNYDVFGCTDLSANNYNPIATVDDGSCEYDVPGCTDQNATNYNPFATVDDGSCEYPVDPCNNEEVLVPNAFTPNNDGLNDEWYPVTNPDCWKYWSVKIFNRWGQLIWETDKADDRWDGTVKDSDNCVSDGVYVYIIVGERYNADIFQKTGHITVFK